MTHHAKWGLGRFGDQTPSQNMHLQIAGKLSVLCCHLVNINEELGGKTFRLLPIYLGPC